VTPLCEVTNGARMPASARATRTFLDVVRDGLGSHPGVGVVPGEVDDALVEDLEAAGQRVAVVAGKGGGGGRE
jgi:hypothetical protein